MELNIKSHLEDFKVMEDKNMVLFAKGLFDQTNDYGYLRNISFMACLLDNNKRLLHFLFGFLSNEDEFFRVVDEISKKSFKSLCSYPLCYESIPIDSV